MNVSALFAVLFVLGALLVIGGATSAGAKLIGLSIACAILIPFLIQVVGRTGPSAFEHQAPQISLPIWVMPAALSAVLLVGLARFYGRRAKLRRAFPARGTSNKKRLDPGENL